MRRRLMLGLAVLALLGFLAVMLEPTCVLWGLLTGEGFYRGRPTSYWRREIIRAEEVRGLQLSPPPKPILPNLFPSKKPSEVKELALWADPEAVPVLTDMLRDRVDYVRWKAAFALVAQVKARLPERDKANGRFPPAPWLGDKLGPRTGLVVRAVAEVLIRPPANPRLVVDELERAEAAKILFDLGQDAEPAIPALVVALKDDGCTEYTTEWCSQDIGALAAVILARMGPPGVQALLTALKTDTVDVRKRVIAALGTGVLNVKESSPALRKALEDESVCVEGAYALWKIEPKNDATIPALVRCLRGRNSENRGEAARMLGYIGPEAKEAVPALLSALSDPVSHVRAEVIAAIKRIDPQAVPADLP
jgi:HEAT repeat protein